MIAGVAKLMLLLALASALCCNAAPAEGKKTLYGIFLCHSGDQWWNSTRDLYNLLTASYGASASNLFVLLVDDGVPDTNSEIVSGKATRLNISNAVSQIASRVDDDDLFLFFDDADGRGYLGYVSTNPDNVAYHGYFGVPPRIAVPGDELDYRESDIELSLFCAAGGVINSRDFHFGMDEWGITWYPGSRIVRYKVLSHFTNIFVNDLGYISDSDIYLERLTDFTLGDFNRNGMIEPYLGEVEDYDGDGNPPWNSETGQFDEDDWGNIDQVEDNCASWHTSLVGVNFQAFDAGLDNHADIDINPSGVLQVDGTDTDNDGCIDGFDLNGDGDKDDWITMDEIMEIYLDSLSDNELKMLLSPLQSGFKVFIINTCFGGGFVNDLSGPNTIVITGSREDSRASASFMPSLLVEAFGDRAGEADADHDGQVSFVEAFNYASLHPHAGCAAGMDSFQYDDNGDFISHEDPLPAWGDGGLGALVGLGPWPAPPTDRDQDDIPDLWEIQFFGSTGTAGISTDSDHDGISDRAEYVAGTSPIETENPLYLSIFSTNGQVLIAFPCIPATGPAYTGLNRIYALERRDTLATSMWTSAQSYTNPISPANVVVWTNGAEGLGSLYRIQIHLQ